MPPRQQMSASVNKADYIAVNDPLVSKSHMLERKVHECINKLNHSKAMPQSYLTPKNHYKMLQEPSMTARNPIELEFKKKKIHFVSEFRLYDERWQLKLI
jgi:hypothetical protein